MPIVVFRNRGHVSEKLTDTLNPLFGPFRGDGIRRLVTTAAICFVKVRDEVEISVVRIRLQQRLVVLLAVIPGRLGLAWSLKMCSERFSILVEVLRLIVQDALSNELEKVHVTVELSGQWKVEQRFLSINWFGNVDKKSKSLVKHNPIMSTSEGICSWLGPLSMPDDELLFTWPVGAVSGELEKFCPGAINNFTGENNGLELLLDTESYDYVLDELGSVGFKISVDHPLDMPVIQQSGE